MLFRSSSCSLTLWIVAFMSTAPLPALAASFSFQYAYESGDVLTGMFDGDLQLDGDTILNVTNVLASFNGINLSTPFTSRRLVIYDPFSPPVDNHLAPFNRARASLSGATLDFVAYELPREYDSSGFPASNIPWPGAPPVGDQFIISQSCLFVCTSTARVDVGGVASTSEPFDSGHWSASPKTSAPIPEPTSAAVFGLGTMIMGHALRRYRKGR